mgnify:CR=1 FL=1
MIGLAVHINLTNVYLQVIQNADAVSLLFFFPHLFPQKWFLETNTSKTMANFPLSARATKRAAEG